MYYLGKGIHKGRYLKLLARSVGPRTQRKINLMVEQLGLRNKHQRKRIEEMLKVVSKINNIHKYPVEKFSLYEPYSFGSILFTIFSEVPKGEIKGTFDITGKAHQTMRLLRWNELNPEHLTKEEVEKLWLLISAKEPLRTAYALGLYAQEPALAIGAYSTLNIDIKTELNRVLRLRGLLRDLSKHETVQRKAQHVQEFLEKRMLK